MPKIIKNTILDSRMWRYLVNFWTVVLFLVIVADFVTRNGLIEFLGPVCTIYIALLAVYSAEKEFERWHDYNIGRHPGEVYVFVWTVLVVVLFGLELVYKSEYVLPSEVFSTYIVVVGILAITRKSRTDYRRKKLK